MALSREQTFLIAKYFLITFTVLTIIATFVGYGVVLHAINQKISEEPNNSGYWKSWRAFVIVYLILEDTTALVGLFGAIKENYRLVFTYAIVMCILWFFNFFNYAIIYTNVFNYLMSLAVIVTAFYFAKRIRQRQIIAPVLSGPHLFVSPTTVPAPAVIQVSPSYVPSPAYMTSTSYTTSPTNIPNAQYSTNVECESTPPPPYSTQPKLEFKY